MTCEYSIICIAVCRSGVHLVGDGDGCLFRVSFLNHPQASHEREDNSQRCSEMIQRLPKSQPGEGSWGKMTVALYYLNNFGVFSALLLPYH